MLPVAQLDPSSLTLWLNPELVAAAPGGAEALQAADLAARGDFSDVVSFVTELPDIASRTRSAHMASVVWHEQRHFVDLLLTNYGAFRVRQFFKLYANSAAILSELRKASQPLFCPFDTYADPVRCATFEIEKPPDAVMDASRNLLDHASMIRDDRNLIPTPFGRVEMGGEAQLEALAFFCQVCAIKEVFGAETMANVQRSHSVEFTSLRYRWAALVANHLGMADSKKVSDDLYEFRGELLFPLLLGSLASRRYGQTQVKSDSRGGSGFPTERLYGFLQALSASGKATKVESTLEGWELVNKTAKDLWGRTVIEETQSDFQKEEELCKAMEANQWTPDPVKRAFRDYHSLRGYVINLLQSEPLAIIDPTYFAKSLLQIVRPQPILVRNGGTLGDPPEGFLQVLGYHDVDDQDHEEGKWWWAVTPPPEDVAATGISLSEWKDWLSIVEHFAPLAKLMLHGRRHRIMLGPELMAAQMRLSAQGIPLRFDPHFEFPVEWSDVTPFWRLTELQEAACDFCKAKVPRGQGRIVHPWFFRRNIKRAEIAIQAFGGGKTGRLRFLRDWSVWLVCDACAADEFLELHGSGKIEPGAVSLN